MTRKKFTSKFKTKVVLEAIKEQSTSAELAQKHKLHPGQISTWKREFLAGASTIFEKGSGTKSKRSEAEEKEDDLLKIIGQQKVELDFLKKSLR